MLLHALIDLQFPADGVLISGQSLAIDESSMTGESKIVSVDKKKRENSCCFLKSSFFNIQSYVILLSGS
jgi:magnesium-transporting ATPase (P-type)